MIRYDPDGTSTVLMRDTPGGGFFWDGITNLDYAPGMAVAKDGTVYLGIGTYLSNSASTVIKLIPGQQRQLVPMQERIYSSALAVGDDGSLYVVARDGVIKKVLSEGTMVTVLNRDRIGFWGERSFESEPLLRPRINHFASDGRGGLLAADSAVRRIALACPVEPGPALTAVVESATSNSNLWLAAGQLISLYGFRLGPASAISAATDETGHYPTELDGTQVLIDGIAAPLLYAGANQVNAIVPFSIDGHTRVPIEVVRNGRRSDVVTAYLGRIGPAIFDYAGPGTVPDLYARMVNEDGSINGPDKPAKAGSVVTVYASGLGITAPAGEDGRVADLNLKRPVHPVTLRVGSQDVEVVYAGTAPGIVEGVMQIVPQLTRPLLFYVTP